METTVEIPIQKNVVSSSFHFAVKHRRDLLAISVAPIFVQLLIISWGFVGIATIRKVFLVGMLDLLAGAWLVATAAMFSITVVRGDSYSVKSLLRRSLQHLPKIFFSYFALVLVVQSALLMPPLLLFAVFFIWAPFFCIAETFVPRIEKEVDEYDYPEDQESERSKKEFTWLSDKALLDLGFARSVHLVGSQVATTALTAVVIWFGLAVPQACLSLFAPAHEGFFTLAAKVVVLGLSMVVLSTMASLVLVCCLPQAARDEMNIPQEWYSKIASFAGRVRSDRYRIVAIFLICLISLVATMFLNNKRLESRRPPESMIATSEVVKWKGDRLACTVQIEDSEAGFQWLTNTDAWRLRLDKSHGGVEKEKQNGVLGSLQPSTENTNLLSVSQVRIRSLSGEEKVIDQSTLFEQNATFIFYFDLPKELVVNKAQLVHVSQFGELTDVVEILIPTKPKS